MRFYKFFAQKPYIFKQIAPYHNPSAENSNCNKKAQDRLTRPTSSVPRYRQNSLALAKYSYSQSTGSFSNAATASLRRLYRKILAKNRSGVIQGKCRRALLRFYIFCVFKNRYFFHRSSSKHIRLSIIFIITKYCLK